MHRASAAGIFRPRHVFVPSALEARGGGERTFVDSNDLTPQLRVDRRRHCVCQAAGAANIVVADRWSPNEGRRKRLGSMEGKDDLASRYGDATTLAILSVAQGRKHPTAEVKVHSRTVTKFAHT